MTHTSSFDITTAREFFDGVVIPQYDDFIANNASQRHAILSTIVTYHMYEWVNLHKFSQTKFATDYPNDTAMIDYFELARNMTNGMKHFIPNAANTRTQTGFSSAFDNSFARPLLVTFDDGAEISADDFLSAMIGFWKACKF